MALTRDRFDVTSPAGKGEIKLPLEVQVARGETDVDDSAQTETTASLILTIAAPSDAGMQDCEVWFDLDKATTGHGAVETTATIEFRTARAVDGTNYRTAVDGDYDSVALTGTLATADQGQAAVVKVGDIAAGEDVQIFVDMSADATADIELPYMVSYKSRGTATITPVVAG
jgi:hypothetical protein